jgi:16S rRNA processing protein RimM
VGVQLVVGRIGRPHGVRGQLTVDVRTDDPAGRYAAGAVLVTEPPERGPLTVSGSHWHGGRLLVSFAGVEDRAAAELLRGTVLLVEQAEDERPGDPEEFYDHQLIGLRVVTASGEPLGPVTEVLHLPGQDVLVVSRVDRSDALIPFVAAIVPQVDLTARRVVVAPPAGLLDLDVGPAGAGTPADPDAD